MLVGVGACDQGAERPGETANPIEGGPLRVPPDNVYFVRYEKGEVFSDGFQRLVVEGTEPAVIDSVEMVGMTDGLELVGTRYAGRGRKYGAIQVLPHFPPRHQALGPLRQLRGAVVRPGRLGLELIVGLRVVEDGYSERRAVRVYYEVGGTEYVVDLPAGIVVCPKAMTTEHCQERYADWA